MPRRIAFLGDCQARALCHIYSANAALEDDYIVMVYHDANTQASFANIASADIIVSQQFDVERHVTTKSKRPEAKEIRFPAIFGGFLWPSIRPGQHPKNARTRLLPDGPFPWAEVVLDRMVADNKSPDEALMAYEAFDLVKEFRLGRIMELQLDAQSLRDEKTDFRFSEFIRDNFRDAPLFMSNVHPDLPLFIPLLRGVFEQLGATSEAIDRSVAATPRAPFPQTAVPIHPRVAQHFNLKYVRDNLRYPRWHGTTWTFSEYVRQYVGYTGDWTTIDPRLNHAG